MPNFSDISNDAISISLQLQTDWKKIYIEKLIEIFEKNNIKCLINKSHSYNPEQICLLLNDVDMIFTAYTADFDYLNIEKKGHIKLYNFLTNTNHYFFDTTYKVIDFFKKNNLDLYLNNKLSKSIDIGVLEHLKNFRQF